MKIKKYHTVGTVPKSNKKNVERVKVDTTNKHILQIIPNLLKSWVVILYYR